MAERENVLRWTDSQDLAIRAERKNLIVSAAAGSGKTAALTERIFRLLTDENDPIPLSEIVAITFTRAAARNLKEKLSHRIARAQAENPKDTRLYRLQMQLPYANISTVHSFCLRIVEENAELLGLPARLRLGEEATLFEMQTECMTRALHELRSPRAGETPEETRAKAILYKVFGAAGKSETEAPKKLYDRLRSLEDGIGHLSTLLAEQEKNLADMKAGTLPLLDSALGELIRKQILYTLNQLNGKLHSYFSQFPVDERSNAALLPAAVQMKSELEKLLAVCSDHAADYEDVRTAFSNIALKNYKNDSDSVPHNTPQGAALHELYKTILKELKTLKKNFGTDADTILRQEEVRLFVSRELYRLLVSFETLYNEKKREKGILDYSDLEHYGLLALKKLQENGAATSYCRALFVDEYQDTNRLQDEFFRKCIGKDGFFFFVGDIKQSIYLFRNAAPELFLGYKNGFPLYQENEEGDEEALGRSIFFSQNFRSDETVINFANDVFRVLLNDQTEESQRMYAKEDELDFSKQKGTCRNLPVEYYLVDNDKSDSPERRDEYTLVIDKIRHLIEVEKRRPEEIAVIAYSNRTLTTLRSLLIQSGISVAPGSPELLTRPEVTHFTALLSAVCDPFDDISLVALCTSPLFSFSSEELSDVRSKADGAFFNALMIAGDKSFTTPVSERSREVLDFLDLWQDYARTHTPSETVLHLLRSTGILEAISEGDDRKRENLLALYQLSRNFGSGSATTLSDFLSFIDSGRSIESPSASDPQPREGFVTLMTVHKSKGLDFPVCIYMSLSKDPVSEPALFLNLKHGLFLKDLAPNSNLFVPTVPYRATKRLQKEERLEEEKRLLYVGITRTIEKLILIDVLKGNQGNAKKLFADVGIFPPLPDGAIHSHELSRPDQLLLYSLRDDAALCSFAAEFSEKGTYTTGTDGIACRNFRLHVLSSSDLPTLPQKAEAHATAASPVSARFAPEREQELVRALNAEAERRNATLAPSKLSVSEILHLDKTPENGKTHLSFSSDDRVGARHGTAMHAFMQFCDFAAAKTSPETEAARLADRAFLTKEQAEGLNFLALSRFFSSGTFAEIEKSPRVKRELRFNVFLPAEKLLKTGEGEILIQGVIDCFYEKEDGTYAILDFKTDAVNPKNGEDVLRDRHAKQLRLYALALKELTGKDVTKLALYSFSLSREIEIASE